jgi:hypothetical protein
MSALRDQSGARMFLVGRSSERLAETTRWCPHTSTNYPSLRTGSTVETGCTDEFLFGASTNDLIPGHADGQTLRERWFIHPGA